MPTELITNRYIKKVIHRYRTNLMQVYITYIDTRCTSGFLYVHVKLNKTTSSKSNNNIYILDLGTITYIIDYI